MRLARPAALATLALLVACHSRSSEPVASTTRLTSAQAPVVAVAPRPLFSAPDVAGIAKDVAPAVVNITAMMEMPVPQALSEFDPFRGRGPFRSGAPPPQGKDFVEERALGSGFILDPEGHVATNAHVVEGADLVRVKLADEREFDADVIGRDKRLDVAVLKLRGARDLPTVSMGASGAMRVGDYVLAIGNPFGLGGTVTMGIVSAKRRSLGIGPYDDFLQTDASINPGNSGGPLFNLNGEVVGINTAISATGQGIGFAIPSDTFRAILPQLLERGRVDRGHLGARVQEVDAALADALALERAYGALVDEVEPDAPADKAGLLRGDVILAVDGSEVTHAQDLLPAVAGHAPGSRISLRVARGHGTRVLFVGLDALPGGPEANGEARVPPSRPPGLGVKLDDAQGGGALVSHVLPGALAEGELHEGDVLLEIAGVAVRGAEDASRHIERSQAGKATLFLVRRGSITRYVAIERR